MNALQAQTSSANTAQPVATKHVATANTVGPAATKPGVAELSRVLEPVLGQTQAEEIEPYVHRWRGATVVVKLGGSAMTDPALADVFAADAVLLSTLGIHLVLVHGGGPQIADMMKRLGKKPEFNNGLRVTDAETLEIAQMVLAGKVNSDIVRSINVHGSKAVGVSGADARLITAVQRDPALGFVGDVAGIDPALLLSLMSAGMIPVVSTIGSDISGQAYNINADTAAAAIAAELSAEKLLYLTDVAGLYQDLDDQDSLISHTTASELSQRLANGELAGGMIPKIDACVYALGNGVGRAHLLDGRVPHAALIELFTDAGVGTMITNEAI